MMKPDTRHVVRARDIAFEDPVTEDQTARMLARMGIGAGAYDAELTAMRDAARAARALPDAYRLHASRC